MPRHSGAGRQATQPMPATRRPSRHAVGWASGFDRSQPDGEPARGRARRALAVVGLLLTVAIVAVIVVAKPFGSSHPASASTSDNAIATSLATVERRSLSSQQTEDGTLGYAGSYTVVNQAGASDGGEEKDGEKGGGGGGSTITSLPAAGQVVGEGQVLYEVNGEPVVLLYGATPAYRTLSMGMSGKDVAELNSDLIALGYADGAGIGEHPEYFGSESEDAVKGLQEKLGVSKTGKLTLGQAVFQPSSELRITRVMGTLGGDAQAGSPLLEASSTGRQVVVKLDAAEQSSIKQGDRVTITLPNNQTTPGVVSSVGKVAKSSSGGGGKGGGGEEEGTPTIEVQITPTDPGATGTLDQAPVRVAITTASVPNVLAVPVSALVALAEGGYAVEVAEGRYHHLVGVTLGLFDDAEGKVRVSGAGLHAGQQVVVPSA
jgi:Putative peptidoglycan binding domain